MTAGSSHQSDRASKGAEDAGRYFRYMAEFVGLTDADASAIRRTKPVIEKHLPEIVATFYEHLLRYPPTRKFFLKPDGTLDEPYVEQRMRHLSNFWLRTADALFDDEYARYVDYVGRAHTSRGADPNIYIAERYVIGQVGLMQHAVGLALRSELKGEDEQLEFQAVEAWSKLMMVILEMLSRAYGHEREAETYGTPVPVDKDYVGDLAQHAVAHEMGEEAPPATREIVVAAAAEIAEGERKIVRVGELSIGVFHQDGEWIALANRCVHRGGPVATGELRDHVLVCPWHGFQYDIRTGAALVDPSAKLDRYPVTIRSGQVVLTVPEVTVPSEPATALAENEFRLSDVTGDTIGLVSVAGVPVAVFQVDGSYYATANACTHASGPLNEGELNGREVVCPWHGSCFDVTTGAATCGPASESLPVYKVTLAGGIGRVGKAASA